MGPDGVSTGAMSLLERLPDDILGNIFERLDLDELLGLGILNKGINERLTSLGIPLYLNRHTQHHLTLDRTFEWTPYHLLKHNTLINRSLSTHQWHALQVGPTWPSSVIPAMSLSTDRLIYGVGGKLVVHDIAPRAPLSHTDSHSRNDRGGDTKTVKRAREYHVAHKWAGSKADIIGVCELGDDQRQIIVAQFDGTLQRFALPRPNSSEPVTLRSTAHYTHPPNSDIHTLSVSSGNLMTTTSSGLVSLFKASSPWVKPITLSIKQKTRAWSSLLALDLGVISPCLMIGISGSIDVYPIDSAGNPSLTPSRQLVGPKSPSRSSPYDIVQPPSTSWHNPNTLLSAWYDSYIRLHDLRLPSPNPVMQFNDPWADSPMYSCCFTGTYHVVGGGARHGMVGFWDTRYVRGGNGWSCFTPSGKGSPVYKLAGEGGRVWGVTEKRGFVLGFDGSGAHLDGLVQKDARGMEARARGRAAEVPTKYRSRGGKWGWSVRYETEEKEVGIGYEHRDRVVKLFNSLPVL